MKQFYEFGPFRIDSTERLLLRNREVVPLTPKVFDTLLVFVENSGRILGKEDLMKMVWADAIVEQINLSRNVSVLRKALGETPGSNQYIKTIPWRGYSFVASVREVWDEAGEERSTPIVVIDQEVGAPALRAELDPIVPDNSFNAGVEENARRRRRVTLIAAVGAALITVFAAVSFSWDRGGSKRYTESPEAYHAYLKGRFWWNKRSEEGFKRAIEFYQEAIALDHNYALPYAGLADCYVLMSPYNIIGPKEGYPKAKAAAVQALAIDHQLAEAHASLAHLTWLYEWNFPAAEAEFKQAIRLDVNYPTAHQWYSVYLSSMGRHDEAITEAKLAYELNPLSLSIIQDLARAYYHAGRYDDAIAAFLKALELNPQYRQLNSWLESSYEQKGLYDRVVDERLNSLKVNGGDPDVAASLKEAFSASGWKGYWKKELDLAKTRSSLAETSPYLLARIYVRLGENDRALEWLEKAYAERVDYLVLLKVDPVFNPLRSDPQFNDLLRRVGFGITSTLLSATARN